MGNRESSRWAASLLGRSRTFLLLKFVTLVYLLLKATHVPHSDTAASAWVVPCEGVLPSQIELVGSIASFPKRLLR